MRFLAAALLIFATAAVPAAAQTVSGTVMDSTTNTRIAAAQVVLLQEDSSATVLTDAQGRFRFFAKPGMFALQVRALGFEELQSGVMQVGKNENVSVLIFPSVTAVEIPPVMVIARNRRPLTGVAAFERRKRLGFGYFIDEKMIDKLPAMNVSDLLRRVPGAMIGTDRVSFRGCYDATWVVDGMPIYASAGMTATEQVNMLISPTDVAGLEVYKGDAGVPIEIASALAGVVGQGLGGNESCGVVAVWTKR